MKLLELLPLLKDFTRIKRKGWSNFLVKSEYSCKPLIECDFYSLQLREYTLTFEDLISEDWDILNDY